MRTDLAAGELDDGFLVADARNQVPICLIPKARHLHPHFVVPARPLPQLHRLHQRHHNLLAIDCSPLLSHHVAQATQDPLT
jgi:hypothetical protein